MPNMNYCRFQNTLIDLTDCRRTIADMAYCPEECGSLSREELQAAKAIAEEAMALLQMIADYASVEVHELFDTDKSAEVLAEINHAVIDAELMTEEMMAEENNELDAE